MGANKRPFYRVVVADQRSPRDGRFIENIGKYHPLEDPSLIEIDEERAMHWLMVGAQPSDQVRNLMVKIGIWDKFVAERPEAAKLVKTRVPKDEGAKLSKKAAAKVAEAKVEAAKPAPAPAAKVETVEPEPEALVVETVEPEAVEPEAVEPEAVEPEAVEPEAVEPESAVAEETTEAVEPEGAAAEETTEA
jgi:small subunit ribosomal protein S16